MPKRCSVADGVASTTAVIYRIRYPRSGTANGGKMLLAADGHMAARAVGPRDHGGGCNRSCDRSGVAARRIRRGRPACERYAAREAQVLVVRDQHDRHALARGAGGRRDRRRPSAEPSRGCRSARRPAGRSDRWPAIGRWPPAAARPPRASAAGGGGDGPCRPSPAVRGPSRDAGRAASVPSNIGTCTFSTAVRIGSRWNDWKTKPNFCARSRSRLRTFESGWPSK